MTKLMRQLVERYAPEPVKQQVSALEKMRRQERDLRWQQHEMQKDILAAMKSPLHDTARATL